MELVESSLFVELISFENISFFTLVASIKVEINIKSQISAFAHGYTIVFSLEISHFSWRDFSLTDKPVEL